MSANSNNAVTVFIADIDGDREEGKHQRGSTMIYM